MAEECIRWTWLADNIAIHCIARKDKDKDRINGVVFHGTFIDDGY